MHSSHCWLSLGGTYDQDGAFTLGHTKVVQGSRRLARRSDDGRPWRPLRPSSVLARSLLSLTPTNHTANDTTHDAGKVIVGRRQALQTAPILRSWA